MQYDDDQHSSRYAKNPPFGWRLLADRGVAGIWLMIRVYLGLAWLVSAMALLQNAEVLAGTNAAHVAADMLPATFHISPALFVILGATEMVVSLLLLFGAFAGPAAAISVVLGFNALVPGPTGTDPIALGSTLALILAWKVSGWYGFDRWLLAESRGQPRSARHSRGAESRR